MSVNTLSIIDAAWLAGFIDGEGCIRLAEQHWGTTLISIIEISNTYKEVIEYIKLITGAGFISVIEGKENSKTSWKYILKKKDNVEVLLEQILPFLKVKRKQAELLLIYCKEHIPGVQPTDIELEIYDKLKELNKRGR